MNDLFGEIDTSKEDAPNLLLYGDNLTVMQSMKSSSVDLIYLDPPFSSQRNYNMIYKKATGLPVPEQEEAFCDAWEMDEEKEEMVRNMHYVLEDYNVSSELITFWDAWMRALRGTQSRLLAYLVYMTPRLFEMRRLLRPTGQLYLHCDPKASHYIKVILDAVFEHKNFRNEIIWCYRGGGVPRNDFAKKHDVIFRYSKSKAYYFDVDSVRIPYSDNVMKSNPSRYDKSYRQNKVYEGYRLNPAGKHPEDWWLIQPLMPSDKRERLGFPTQKPIRLLDRIIKSSTKEGDRVFDPFCGCGTTIYAAHLNKRKWIGCDIAILSMRMVRDVLSKRYGLEESRDYEVSGIPTSVEGARVLFEYDPHHFQRWAVELTKGWKNTLRSGDKGVDGRIHFQTENGLKNMVLSVKGGKLTPAYIRELAGTINERHGCVLGGFICLNQPTKGMIQAASEEGMWTYSGQKYPRLQIRTIEQLLDKRAFETPTRIEIMDWKRQGELAV